MRNPRRRTILILAAALIGAVTAPVASADSSAQAKSETPTAVPDVEAAAVSGVACEDGLAAGYPCDNVDLESVVPLADLGAVEGLDIWGWTDASTGAEYAIVGTTTGTTFVDVSDPQSPVVLGQMPTASSEGLSFWRDVKVYANHAYVVSENLGHGMQVFDLTRLRDPGPTPAVFAADTVYREFGRAHNVAINTDSGFAYAVATDTCSAGLHMIDIRDPGNPRFAGCYTDDGYIHDVQCVIYHGPSVRFQGRELCFGATHDEVVIVDVTDKNQLRRLSSRTYPNAFSTHQGWLTPDHRWFLFGDEVDELAQTVPGTTTYIMRVTNPLNPSRPLAFSAESQAIDHNLYTKGNLVYEANYTAGLRIYDYDEQSLRRGELRQVGFFDVFPANDDPDFQGAWSSYPYFDSGIVVVSGIDSGLFVLRPRLSP